MIKEFLFMKKFLKVLVSALLVAVTAVTFASCGVPADPAKAQSNLEGKGYTVDTTASYIVVNTAVLADGGTSASGNVTNVIYAYNGDGESVLLVYFKDTGIAKNYLEIKYQP